MVPAPGSLGTDLEQFDSRLATFTTGRIILFALVSCLPLYCQLSNKGSNAKTVQVYKCANVEAIPALHLMGD